MRSLRKYSLTLLDYDEMVKTQDSRCRLCARRTMSRHTFTSLTIEAGANAKAFYLARAARVA